MSRREYIPKQTFITAREVAFRLSVSESKVFHAGKGLEGLTPIRIGKNVRFDLEEVEALERALKAKARAGRSPH